MDMNDYQSDALKTAAITQKGVAALAHRSLGLAGEAGTVANMIKKIIRDRDGNLTEKDIVELKEKLGDTLYYVAVLAEYLGIELSDIAKTNLEKSARFAASRSSATSDNS